MGFNINVSEIEYNGGCVAFSVISTTAYAEPTSYTDFTEFGATDGVKLDFKTATESVKCDQFFGDIDEYNQSTECILTITCEEQKANLIAIACGLHPTSDVVSGVTLPSIHAAGSITAEVVRIGHNPTPTYFDILYEKPQSHSATKIKGFRVHQAKSMGELSLAYKHEDKSFYDIKFKGLIFTLESSKPYYGKSWTWVKQTA